MELDLYQQHPEKNTLTEEEWDVYSQCIIHHLYNDHIPIEQPIDYQQKLTLEESLMNNEEKYEYCIGLFTIYNHNEDKCHQLLKYILTKEENKEYDFQKEYLQFTMLSYDNLDVIEKILTVAKDQKETIGYQTISKRKEQLLERVEQFKRTYQWIWEGHHG